MDPEIAETVSLVRHGALFAALVAALYTDLSSGRIPNGLCLAAAAAGLATAYLLGGVGALRPAEWLSPAAAPTLSGAALGAVAGGGSLFLLYLAGGMGAGDVKLMAAVGALTGAGFTLWAILFTSFVGAAMALAVLLWKGDLAAGLRGAARVLVPWRDRAKDPPAATIPYGVAIAFGTMWAWWQIYGG